MAIAAGPQSAASVCGMNTNPASPRDATTDDAVDAWPGDGDTATRGSLLESALWHPTRTVTATIKRSARMPAEYTTVGRGERGPDPSGKQNQFRHPETTWRASAMSSAGAATTGTSWPTR